MAQCGLLNQDLGFTYLADRLSPSGETIQSALDHVYISHSLESRTSSSTLSESSTDHLPVMVKLTSKIRLPKHAKKSIRKRTMKQFNTESKVSDMNTLVDIL